MAQKGCVPYGSDSSAGTYTCVDCGYQLSIQSKSSLPVCPNYGESDHPQKCWQVASGQGDAPDDPQT